MRWTDVAEHWNVFIGRILHRWPDMEEDELLGIDGDPDHFFDYLFETLGGDADQARREFDEWMATQEPLTGVTNLAGHAARIHPTERHTDQAEVRNRAASNAHRAPKDGSKIA